MICFGEQKKKTIDLHKVNFLTTWGRLQDCYVTTLINKEKA